MTKRQVRHRLDGSITEALAHRQLDLLDVLRVQADVEAVGLQNVEHQLEPFGERACGRLQIHPEAGAHRPLQPAARVGHRCGEEPLDVIEVPGVQLGRGVVEREREGEVVLARPRVHTEQLEPCTAVLGDRFERRRGPCAFRGQPIQTRQLATLAGILDCRSPRLSCPTASNRFAPSASSARPMRRCVGGRSSTRIPAYAASRTRS